MKLEISYNLRSQKDFMGTSVNTSNFVLDLLKYLGTEVWEIARYDIQSIENLEFFKKKIRK